MIAQSTKALAASLFDLNEDREPYHAIIDNCTAVIYLKDLAGRYLFVNRQYEDLFHRNRRDILGKTDFEIFPPEHAAAFRANDLKVLEAGKPLKLEEVAPHDDGPHIYVSLKFPMRDARGQVYGICGISSDITEFKRLEEERNQFFQVTQEMLCIADFEGRFRRINPRWTHILGWSEQELLGRPYLDFVHPDDIAVTLAEASRLAEGVTTVSFENRYRCIDGSYRWLLWNATPVVEQRLIYAAARDITPRKESEQQLAATLEQLQKTIASERETHIKLKQAQSHLVQAEKMVALGQLVAGVAHEINNPLTFVINNLAVLERDAEALRQLVASYQDAERQLGPEHAAAFARVQQLAEEMDAPYTLENLRGLVVRTSEGLKRIQRIVNDLREFARGADRDWHEVDLNEGIRSTLNIIHIRASNRHVTLEQDLGPLPAIRCQPAKINQVVLNLVANAIDACQEGGKVVVRTRGTPAGVEIQVSDNGAGIDPAILNKIFDPFFTTKPPGMGTGLGLSISLQIVRDHRGRIDVSSTPGAGSTFTVTLPARHLNQYTSPSAALPAAPPAPRSSGA